jgi:hypothetical protein
MNGLRKDAQSFLVPRTRPAKKKRENPQQNRQT